MSRGYISGTAHMLNMFDFKLAFDEKIEQCFKESDHLVVELNAVKEIKLKLSDKVENINAFIEEQAESQQSMDLNFLIQAEEKGKTVYELETSEFQQQAQKEYQKDYWKNITSKLFQRPVFGATPEEEIFYKDLDQQLKQKDDFTREGFQEGSESKIEFVANFGLSEGVSKRFYADRNENMAEKIDSLLRKEQGRFFIAIGAGHVVGKKSVPTLLSQQYKWQIKKMS